MDKVKQIQDKGCLVGITKMYKVVDRGKKPNVDRLWSNKLDSRYDVQPIKMYLSTVIFTLHT